MIQLSFLPASLDCGNGKAASYSISTLSADDPTNIPAEALQLAQAAITVSARIDATNSPFRIASITSQKGEPQAEPVGPGGKPMAPTVIWSYEWTNEATQAGGAAISVPALPAPPHGLPAPHGPPPPPQRRLQVAVTVTLPSEGSPRYAANLIVTVNSPGNPDAVATIPLTAEPWFTYHGESADDDAVVGISHSSQKSGVRGENPGGGYGVSGSSNGGNPAVWGSNSAGGSGVMGTSITGYGVYGMAPKGPAGTYGYSPADGVIGRTFRGNGVHGVGDHAETPGQPTGAPQPGRPTGVWGEAMNGSGVVGTSANTDGVMGLSAGGNSAGVAGRNDNAGGTGVLGISTQGTGVKAICESGSSPGLFATSKNGDAALFEGTIRVTGDVALVNQDCAEDFDMLDCDAVEPGTVMVIDESGALRISREAYDRKVAGVVSGAGEYRPGIVLGRLPSLSGRRPVALVGKVCCKVDANHGAIAVGDLLTTSPTPGHAMKAADPARAFGAVIGKALRPLASGQGLVAILIALQ